MKPIDDIREAAGRLHATAWRGRKDTPDECRARFSIPRQPGDDDEVVYSAVEELARNRAFVEEVRRHISGRCAGIMPADCIEAISEALSGFDRSTQATAKGEK